MSYRSAHVESTDIHGAYDAFIRQHKCGPDGGDTTRHMMIRECVSACVCAYSPERWRNDMFVVVVIISSTDPVHELTSCASHTPSIHMKVTRGERRRLQRRHFHPFTIVTGRLAGECKCAERILMCCKCASAPAN